MTSVYRKAEILEKGARPVTAAEMLAAAGARSWAGREHCCPFCEIRHFLGCHGGPVVDRNVCTGSWWPWGCKLRVAHFHVHCESCDARYIMRTADGAR